MNNPTQISLKNSISISQGAEAASQLSPTSEIRFNIECTVVLHVTESIQGRPPSTTYFARGVLNGSPRVCSFEASIPQAVPPSDPRCFDYQDQSRR